MLLTHISVFTNACLIAFQSNWMEDNVFKKIPWVVNYHATNPTDTNYALLAVRLLFIFIYEVKYTGSSYTQKVKCRIAVLSSAHT